MRARRCCVGTRGSYIYTIYILGLEHSVCRAGLRKFFSNVSALGYFTLKRHSVLNFENLWTVGKLHERAEVLRGVVSRAALELPATGSQGVLETEARAT